ncbi:MAG TPA: hypothetical protein VN039_16695, partial [Nitrospira sp.]|nr:hypothetical protein [Nitrospira sp.]
SSKLEEALSAALPSYSQGFTVEVGTPESDADGTGFVPAPRNTPAGITGLTTAQIARDTRSVRVQSAPVAHDGEKRIGRPKTLEGYAASDGGPVREWGTRSPGELKRQGVKVYRPKGSHVAPEPEAEPEVHEPVARPVAKKAAPVVLRRK